jgi:hypothetical protein
MPLPKVMCAGSERPLVCASLSPDTGAAAVASLPLLTVEKSRHTPPADVQLQTNLTRSAPLGVFGDFASVSVGDGAAGSRIVARDLLGETDVDITSHCRISNGIISLPGDMLSEIGRSANPPGDFSSPGVAVFRV